MADLLIRIKRATDGSAALTCVRADGSMTWQRQVGQVGLVMPGHDLTHYAVETALGYQRAFYGLLADGWEISDFAHPWPRGPIPAEAREAELVVGVFDMERRMGGGWSPTELREQAALYASAVSHGHRTVTMPPLTDDDVARVRAERATVLARWAATSPGHTLELHFGRDYRIDGMTAPALRLRRDGP